MSYKGIHISYPLGGGGFNGSRNISSIPQGQLYEAEQIRFKDGTIRTAPGLTLLDSNGVSNANATLLAGHEWNPTESVNKQITVWSCGTIYKEVASDIDAVELCNSLTIAAPVVFVEGGQEDGTGDRKLYLYCSGIPPKVLSGDGTSFSNLTEIPTDWSNAAQPSLAVYHDFRIFAFNAPGFPHTCWTSFIDDHSSFYDANVSPQPPVFRVEPGIGRYVSAAISDITEGSNRLFIFKYPKGIFSLDSTDIVSSYIAINKISLDVGCCGPNAVCQVENDILFIGQNGHVYSLSAVQTSKNVNQADITAALNLTDWIDQYVSQNPSYLKYARLVYNKRRRELWIMYRSTYSTSYLSIGFVVDVSDMTNPKISVENRGEYFEGLWNGQHANKEVIFCGGNGNKIYYENEGSRVIGAATAYSSSFTLPETDFEWYDSSLRDRQKRFDWLEIEYIPQGYTGPINIDVTIDGQSYRTFSTTLSITGGSAIGDTDAPIGTFVIGGGRNTRKTKVRIGGYGRRLGISITCLEAGKGFEIERLTFGIQGLGTEGEI